MIIQASIFSNIDGPPVLECLLGLSRCKESTSSTEWNTVFESNEWKRSRIPSRKITEHEVLV